MDREAWRATVHGVIERRTQLSHWAHTQHSADDIWAGRGRREGSREGAGRGDGESEQLGGAWGEERWKAGLCGELEPQARPGALGCHRLCEQEGRGPGWLCQRRSNCGSAKTQEARLCPPLVRPSLGPRVLVVREGGSWEGAGATWALVRPPPFLGGCGGFLEEDRAMLLGGGWTLVGRDGGDRTEPGPGQRRGKPRPLTSACPLQPRFLCLHSLQGLPPPRSLIKSHLGPLQTFLVVTPLGSGSTSGSSRWKPGVLLGALLHARRAPQQKTPHPQHQEAEGKSPVK